MFYLICVTSISLVVAVILFARTVSLQLSYNLQDQLWHAEQQYQDLEREKQSVITESTVLTKKATETFTLYELMREITAQPNEQDAFAVFKEYLKERVVFNDCQFIDSELPEDKPRGLPENNFVFPLKDKRKRFGYLIVNDLIETDKDTVTILASQFALALRRVKLYREIEELAITDSLTQVHTRHYLLNRFEEEMRRSKSHKSDLALLMVDVDHFKRFNDKYGHLVGDRILHAIGAIIKDSVREIDIVGRYGGEEFCVILPDTPHAGALFAAERIRSAVAEHDITAYDTTVRITISIGIAVFPIDGELSAELIDKADWALYRAKKSGRNQVCSFGKYT